MHDFLQGAGDFALGLGILIGAVVQFLNWMTQKNNANKIAELTTHTNSIKDALVAVTGSSEHAKGVLAGRAELAAENEQR
jgi:hypothetical protein